MKTMDSLPQILGRSDKATNEQSSYVLEPVEIRLIADGKLANLADFAASSRLNATDPKGDTPLHIAARIGNLALCDLFIRSGADPGSLNHDRHTPADVAFAEGHGVAAQLLASLVARSSEPAAVVGREKNPEFEIATAGIETGTGHNFEVIQRLGPDHAADDLDDLLSFEAQTEPEEFFGQYTGETASGTFVAPVSSAPAVSDDEDGNWDLDLSSAQIAGEGIGSPTAPTADHGTENDFLKVRNRGRQSVKRAVVQTGTRLSIDSEICIAWAENILAKGWCSFGDIDGLVAFCEGNGDLEDLRINLQRTVEVAGVYLIEQNPESDIGLFDAGSDVSSDELVEAIQANLTRATRLPGTQRFNMEKADESRLVEPMVRTSKELHLGILASEPAIRLVLSIFGKVLEGSIEPRALTIRSLNLSRQEEAETAAFIRAGEALKAWSADGRILNGKRRRTALESLQALDLTVEFQHALISLLSKHEQYAAEARILCTLLSAFELATEKLILSHLPYVRRFASRNVGEGEDIEDVFQVTFMGLQRSIRRFDPERGYRFLIYATYWMRQALVRWRADEGSAIRVPVHRQEVLARLDRATDLLDVRVDGVISDRDIATGLGLSIQHVRQFRSIPRKSEYPENNEAWDDLLPPERFKDPTNEPDASRIVDDLLAELPERQAEIIRMRFGIGREAEMTLEEIGKLYGVTRERIRQIEAKALLFISHPVRKRLLQTLLGR